MRDDYLLVMAQFGFSPLINKITRPATNICIDHIFVKTKSLANITPIIVQSNITDHYPIILSIGNLVDNRNNTKNPFKLLKIDDKKLDNLIQNHNWSEITKLKDVNKSNHYCTETINNLKNNASTINQFSSKTKKLKPWSSTAIINSIRHRDRLHLQVRTYSLNIKLKEFYLKFRNKLTNILKEAKIIYYKKELQKCSNNTKHKWKIINYITTRRSKTNNF